MTPATPDPFAYALTEESFGISVIPESTRQLYNIQAALTPPQSDVSTLVVPNMYSVTLQQPSVSLLPLMRFYTAARLSGSRSARHLYLATAQQTKYAVTTVHTIAEFKLFSDAVGSGGQFSDHGSDGSITINFKEMTRWWSSHVDGKTIFYKLPEILETHYKKRQERHAELTSMSLSAATRKPNQHRISSQTHAAKVLPAARSDAPGHPLLTRLDAPIGKCVLFAIIAY